MPLLYLCIYVRVRTYTYGTCGRVRTIGAPQHDTKHTMDTSCGTPQNTVYYEQPPGTIHPHLSRVGSFVVHGTATFSFLSLPACSLRLFFFFPRLSCVCDPLSPSLFSSLPHPSCYRVQGQPIEGNFLVPIAFARPPRTIRFVSFPLFFILAPFFTLYFPLFLRIFIHLFLFLFPLFRRVALQIRGDRCQNGGEKHRWILVRNAFDRWRAEQDLSECELKLKIPLILREIFVSR